MLAPKIKPSDHWEAQRTALVDACETVAINPLAPNDDVPLGTCIASGTECLQSGRWQCNRQDSLSGTTRYIPIGMTMPTVTVTRKRSAWQKLRGKSSLEQASTIWILLSYEYSAT